MTDFDLTVLLASIVAGAAPIVLAVLGETISEKGGVINLSLDGSILLSAMVAFAIAYQSNNLFLGFAGGALVGAMMAAVVGFFSVSLGLSQVAVGFVLTLTARDLAYFPADRVMRARARLFLFRFEQEMFSHVIAIEKGTQKQADKGRQTIRDALTQIAPVFAKQKYMLGEEFSMLDVAIAPLLWRLDHYGIQLGKQAAPLMKYAERLYSRPAYIDALTASEKVMR